MSWTNLKLGDNWQGKWPERVDVIAPDCEEYVSYVPLVPWDGEEYHCIYCGAELRGYRRKCACGERIYGYEDTNTRWLHQLQRRGTGAQTDEPKETGSVDAERDSMFAKAIRRSVEKNTDSGTVNIELSHIQADELLCDLLLSHGYTETVDEFRNMERWYA